MNLPNKITLFRVVLIPIYLWIYLAQPLGAPASDWVALAIFSVAAITDAIDGYIARSYNLITNFGKLMDPLADKLLVCAALIAFVETGNMPGWAAIVMVSREFFISGMRQIALEKGLVLAASKAGKIKTITQMTFIIYILIPMYLLPIYPGEINAAIEIVLLYAATIASVLSGIDYAVRNWSLFQQV